MPSKRRASSSASKSATPKKPNRSQEFDSDDAFVEEPVFDNASPAISKDEDECRSVGEPVSADEAAAISPKLTSEKKPKRRVEKDGEESRFVGKPVPVDEAPQRWPLRYQGKKKRIEIAGSKTSNGQVNDCISKDDAKDFIQARQHFTQAKIDGRLILNLGDDASVLAEEGQDNYICRIVEMFEGMDGTPYFTAQWFYRAKDTVIKTCCNLIDDKRVFLSEIKDDNPLDCLVEKLKIVRLPINVDLATKRAALSDCDYYYDMLYLVPYSSFVNLAPDNGEDGSESDSTISSETDVAGTAGGVKFVHKVSQVEEHKRSEMSLLDLYSGCGAMSTGLCLGANISGVNLVTKWAVDLNSHACDSLRLNHPETQVRNESAEDFLSLLKEWEKLCASFSFTGGRDTQQQSVDPESVEYDESGSDDDDGENDSEVFEVEEILSICYGDPKENEKPGLYLKIRWKGYGPDEDTWEPIDGLGDCGEKINEFVTNGYRSRILPLPGNVDVICGGPPCQGISGFNRFRNKESPLDDPKNKQLTVFMDIVDYLRPKFVLMENVVDLIKFAEGFLGRYALGRLVGMNYQARMGMMAAGAYGLPQYRMRVFMWGACPAKKLPQYPLPTHNVIVKGGTPVEFESNAVAYDEGHEVQLEKELLLGDAISDLPPVENDEAHDEMPYGGEPKTEFQHFIRLRMDEMPGCSALCSEQSPHVLFDHQPLLLNEDDYQRVCQIPKRKGANFRDLKGVRVRDDNKVEWDPNVERVYLPSGKPLVPDYAMSFVRGVSSKPFGRLWWDETVPTVVTRAEPHNQKILHPQQDRVLTIRENARLQGFPDYYKLVGPIKERYIQVGNAVAVPVARALGYALGLAFKNSCSDEPVFTLPGKFPKILERLSPALDEDDI